MISQNSTSKYQTKVWLNALEEEHPTLTQGIRSLHRAICLADDIADRQLHPEHSAELLWKSILGLADLNESGHFWSMFKVLNRIYDAEVINLSYVPGQFPLEEELELWKLRANDLDLYFEAFCCVMPDLRNEKNEKWFEEFKRYALIHNDCMDIITSAFEDLIRCRRNFVVLTGFGSSGYFNWRDKIDQLKQEAQKVLDGLVLSEPSDERLKIFMRGRDNNE